jgi:hypothetical protein
MFAVFFWSVLGAFAILAIGSLAWVSAEENGLVPTDLLMLLAPFVLWFLLLFLWRRPKSLSNLVELFALVPIIGTCLAVRAFGFNARSHIMRSSVALVVCLAATVALYAFMPVLPE